MRIPSVIFENFKGVIDAIAMPMRHPGKSQNPVLKPKMKPDAAKRQSSTIQL